MILAAPDRPMIGLMIATTASVVNVLTDVCRKKAVVKNDLIASTFWIRTSAGFVFALAFLWRIASRLQWFHGSGASPLAQTWPHLGTFLFLLTLDTSLVGIGLLFYFRALQISDLSLCMPFLSFTPVLLIPTGYFFLHEVPNFGQLLGVILVVCGSIAMNREAFRGGLFGPVRAIFKQRGSRYMLIMAVILSITNPIDKRVVLLSDPVTYAFGYGTMIWLFFAGLMLWRRTGFVTSLRKSPGWIALAGILDAATLLLQFTSHGYIDVVVTITIKRAGVVLSVIAGWLIFRERHIRDRLVASAVMLSGVLLLYITLGRPAQLLLFVGTLVFLAIMLWVSPLAAKVGSESCSDRGRTMLQVVQSEPTKQIRCAFVGCGEITRQYLGVYRDLDWVTVAACVDIDLERAQIAADRLHWAGNGRVVVTEDLQAALTPDIDLVIVGTPNDLHREHAVAALERGKHVLLQKPLAATLDDGRAIVRAAASSTGRAGVYMSYFDQPLMHDLRRMVEEGWFGEITQIHARVMHPGGFGWSNATTNGARLWRSSLQQTGGGAFIQLAVHYIRLLHWILDEPITSVQGQASNRLCPELEGEDSAAALLRLASGIYATLNISWCATGEELAIHGLRGSVVYQDNRWVTISGERPFKGDVLQYRGPEFSRTECIPPSLGDAQQRFNQHRSFLEAIRNGTAPFVTVGDALKDMAVVSAFYESVRTERVVPVPRS